MNFSEEIRQKIIYLFYQTQKVGNLESLPNGFFDFLNNYSFEPNDKVGMGETIRDVSINSLKSICNEVKTNPMLFNKFNIASLEDFINTLEWKNGANLIRTPLEQLINENGNKQKLKNKEYIKNIEQKSIEISNKYGLKSCYYIVNKKKQKFTQEDFEQEIFSDAMTGLIELESKLELIQKKLNIQQPHLVGNNMLNIELDFSDNDIDGMYNSCNTTIVLNKRDNPPLLHEYIHFLDKTNAALLLTGKTTQDLFENKEYNANEFVQLFNMNHIIQMKNIGLLDLVNNLKFNKDFKKEIQQTEKISNIFNEYNENHKDKYNKEFKSEIFKWISQQTFSGKDILCKEVFHVIDNEKLNISNINVGNNIKHKSIDSLMSCVDLYKKKYAHYQENNFMLFAKALDINKWEEKIQTDPMFKHEQGNYYQSHKEMLARTIEKHLDSSMVELHNILSTPTLDIKTNNEIISIIKEWKDNIDKAVEMKHQSKVKNNIKFLSDYYNPTKNHINNLKKIIKI